jgi:GNAT superfamily N-acetyltransferase
MAIEIREVTTLTNRKQFVELPFRLYKNNAYWVPPIKADEINILDPKHNPAFLFCKVKSWLAFHDKECVGRICAIVNEKYNDKVGVLAGRISRVEFADDAEVSDLLFQTAENWLREQGMKEVQGPLGFTNLDTQGLLIEGFEHLQSIASVYHHPYYKDHFERLGYKKEIDWIEFRLTVDGMPEKTAKLAELICRRYQLKPLTFTRKKDLLPYGPRIFKLLNTAFEELFSVVALDEAMIRYYTNKYLKLLNPNFVKLVETKEGDLAGFTIGVPSFSKAMQKAKGKLFPFGFIPVMHAQRHPEVIDLFLSAVDPKIQGMGIPALLINELHKTTLAYHVKFLESTGIFETNLKAVQLMKNYTNIQHKRKRCFKKTL